MIFFLEKSEDLKKWRQKSLAYFKCMSDIFHSFHVSPTFVCITLLDYRAVQIYVGTWRISEQFLATADSFVIGINFYFFATSLGKTPLFSQIFLLSSILKYHDVARIL